MPEGAIEFLKITGASGLGFIMFYFYHKATTVQLNTIIERTFELLKTMIEQNTLQLSYLQKIDTEVTNNLWCPYVKEKSGVEKDE